MEALHFGAGNIGRGFIGKLLADSGIQVKFADVNEIIINEIKKNKRYPVNIAGKTLITEWVENVDAILSMDKEELTNSIAKVDLITTAVGPQVLTYLVKDIIDGLLKRIKLENNNPLNIIACENMVKGSTSLKNMIIQVLDANYHSWLEKNVGFVDCAVDRIVPITEKSDNILEVTVEEFSEWIVDANQFKGNIPHIKGMQPVDNLIAFIERKLFTLNTGHAVAAYLGTYYNINNIRDSILNPKIREIVIGSMQESGNVLIKRYAFEPKKHQEYIDKIITRFENPYIHDDTKRVGRQPIRKLSPNERLIKPLLGTMEYKTPNDNLIIGIACALNYHNEDDEQAKQLKELITNKGVKKAFCEISNISEDNKIVSIIVETYEKVLANKL